MTKIKIQRIELICQLLNEGKTYKEISNATGMKVGIVKYYIYRYMQKTTKYEIIRPISSES